MEQQHRLLRAFFVSSLTLPKQASASDPSWTPFSDSSGAHDRCGQRRAAQDGLVAQTAASTDQRRASGGVYAVACAPGEADLQTEAPNFNKLGCNWRLASGAARHR